MNREDMNLPVGKTCRECMHVDRCTMLFSVNKDNTHCDFAPSRFQGIVETYPTEGKKS